MPETRRLLKERSGNASRFGMKGVDVAEVGGDDEAAFGRGEAIGFSGDFVLPKWLAGFGVEDGDLVFEADDELASGYDEFERGGVFDAPEKASF